MTELAELADQVTLNAGKESLFVKEFDAFRQGLVSYAQAFGSTKEQIDQDGIGDDPQALLARHATGVYVHSDGRITVLVPDESKGRFLIDDPRKSEGLALLIAIDIRSGNLRPESFVARVEKSGSTIPDEFVVSREIAIPHLGTLLAGIFKKNSPPELPKIPSPNR